MPFVKPTPEEIRKTARAAVSALEKNNLKACLFGSAACAIYGMENRVPNDVDLIVLTNTIEQEQIKRLLVSTDNDFFLVPSTNPRANYRVLWYNLDPYKVSDGATRCKVDVLVPGVLSIPNIPPRLICFEQTYPDIPLTPFFTLLLLKLRGWWDHLTDHREYMWEKVPFDERDIEELLELAVEEYEVHLQKERWLPMWLIEESEERARYFVIHCPDTTDAWSEIGLDLDFSYDEATDPEDLNFDR